MFLEICVDSLESAIAAERGGADRVELCSNLLEGGTTPSAGLIRAVRARIAIGLWVMIRPRGGDFFYSEAEIEIMRHDIEAALECGANGVVLGVLTANGEVDVRRTRHLVELATPMYVTFHRAIDKSRNLIDSVERVIETEADGILTSGGMQTAHEGADQIAAMVEAAEGQVRVMVCGGIRPGNVSEIVRKTGADDVHSGLRSRVESPIAFRKESLSLSAFPDQEYARYIVLPEEVQALRQAIEGIGVQSV